MSSYNTTSNNNGINPKPCVYNCSTRIYWNTQENSYFEVFTKKKHICPNRSSNNANNNNKKQVILIQPQQLLQIQ